MSRKRKRNTAKRTRSLRLESLERRNLLAADGFHNFLDPSDVNHDQQVTPIDALAVINQLNRSNQRASTGEAVQLDNGMLWDVNDDGEATPLDALAVINEINHEMNGDDQELEVRFTGEQGARVKVKYDAEDGERELEVRLEHASPNASFDVTFADQLLGQIHTDSRGRGRLELDDEDFMNVTLPPLMPGDTFGIAGIGSVMIPADFGGDQEESHEDDGEEQEDPEENGEENNNDEDADEEVEENEEEENDGGPDEVDEEEENGENTNPPGFNGIFTEEEGEWTAILTGMGGARGEAEFESGPEEASFDLEVRGLAPNLTYPVTVNDVVIGQLHTNREGRGKLEYRFGGRHGMPVPDDLPTLGPGANIAVGNVLSGMFGPNTEDD